jgi:hypothetical protein
MLPLVHAASTEAFSALPGREGQQLVDLSDSPPAQQEPRHRTRH